MARSVKNRIQLGTFFLFLLVVSSGGFSMYYLVKLRNSSKNVLRSNYETLQYSHRMQQALDSIKLQGRNFLSLFEKDLNNQESNITEKGEREATQQLRADFNQLQSGDTSTKVMADISYQLQQILSLNMDAIKNKNAKAEQSAEDALTLVIMIVVFIFLVGFTFALNFPSVLIAPIQKLSEGIREIGQKNYGHRIHIDSRDEFGALADAFNEMAGRLQYFESSNLNKLLFEKTRAEAVINSLRDASIGTDKNNQVLFANEQALQLLGLGAGDIVGKSVEEVSQRNDLFKFLLDNDSKAPFKIVVDNRENYFTRETIEVSQGESNSRVIIIKNITSFKELDVAKTNFIATISHEIKTPLAASDFSLKLLEDERIGTLSAEQKELVQNIKQDNQRILKILSELLTMSQVEAGRIQLNRQWVKPYIILEDAVATIASSAREKNISLHEEVQDNLPELNVDAGKTTWVLNNFLTNAIKYAPSGSTLHLAIRFADGVLRFSVRDDGPGIAKEYQGRLFERYFQVPGSASRGNGLGLAISKDFIEAQGGKIWVESAIGKGSTFGIDFSVK